MFPVNGTNLKEMVLQSQKGIRTLIVMVDQATKNKLIKQFAVIMKPYSR